jgi:hypothetical protein
MINKFHDHLDICKQCREHPFDLCPVGVAAMRNAAAAIHSTRVDENGVLREMDAVSKYPKTTKQKVE